MGKPGEKPETTPGIDGGYRTLFDANPQPMWVYDRETLAFLAVNDAAVAQYGYTREGFLSMTIRDIRPAEEVPALEALIRDLPLGVSDSGTWHHIKRDGSLIDVEVTSHQLEFAGRSARLALLTDVTERTAAEKQARRASSLLQATLDSTADGILVVDQEGKITAFNQRFVELWRIPREIIDSRDDDRAIEFVLDQLSDAEAFVAKVRELYSHPRADSFDVLLFKDGREFERYSAPQMFDGEPVGRVWSFRDVTRRADTEREAREAEAKYRDLVERIPAVVYLAMYGDGAPWLYISPRVHSMLGYTPDEWIDDPALWLKRLHPDDFDRVRQEEIRSREADEPFSSEYRFVAREGNTVWVRDEAEVVRDDRGRPVALRGLWYDITEQKEAEEALRESLERFGLVARATNDAVWEWNVNTNEAWWNDQMFRMWGLEPGSVTPSYELWIGGVHPEDRQRVEAKFAATVEGGAEVWSDEFRFTRPDGTVGFVYDRGYIVRDGDGRPLRMVGAMQDITERKETEVALRSSEELAHRLFERLVDAQEEERARIAQDIHDDSIQVVTAVGLRLETLRRKVADPEDKEQLAKLGSTVEAAIARLRSLLFELRPRALDEEGLAAALRLYLDQVEKQSGFECHIDNRLIDEPASGIRTVLFRIAQEAIVNVRKHANAAKVDLLLEPRDGGFHVRVSDDGEGFEGGDGGRSEPGHLGLSSIRERAEMAHGWLKVESSRGRGTVLDFWLPERA